MSVYKPESMKMASYLIDNVVGGYRREEKEINGEWYIAKPELWLPMKKKLRWCKEILQGKAMAVHFKEDEL